jgi:hypothetical protein
MFETIKSKFQALTPMHWASLVLVALAATLMTIACSPSPVYQQSPIQAAQVVAPQPVVTQAPGAAAPSPVVVQAPAAAPAHSGLNDMLVGGLIGHAIGSRGQAAAVQAPPQVINRTVIKKTYVTQAPPVRPSYSSRTYSSSSRSFSSGRR